MYQSRINPEYTIPNLMKNRCLNCDSEFILSDKYKDRKAYCPYCKSEDIEEIVMMDDPDMLNDMGCMAISVFVKKD